MLDFRRILGEHDSEHKRGRAQRDYDDLTNAGVGHALAVKTITDIYAKNEIVVGERERLIQQAKAGVTASAIEHAVATPTETRSVVEKKVADAIRIPADLLGMEKKQPDTTQ